jgi:Domain of unknown function (DUF4157)
MSSRMGRGSAQEHHDAGTGGAAGHAVAAGKRTRSEELGGAVQRKASGDGAAVSAAGRADDWSMSDGMMSAMGLGTESAAATADRGVAGASSQLPHLEAIQRAFGRHDVRGVRAKVGGDAADAAGQLGAEAYATGDRIAFAQAPDLHTAAHEAAHVVQQAGGTVQLKDGIGQAGDLYEQHADAVADAVVAGHDVESMLDGFATPAAKSDRPGAGGEAAVQCKAVQLVASEYKSNVQIKALDLAGFDAYAHAQADWATSTTLGADKANLRLLLSFARKDNGLVLGACGEFSVTDLMVQAIGQGTNNDAKLAVYSRAASPDRNAGTIHIEAPAANLAEAISWGDAITKLSAGIHGLILERVVPQNGTVDGLKMLVDANAIGDFVQYYKDVKPLLDAANGREVLSYLAFHGEGGQGKYAGYKTDLPEIRNYHRFTVGQLDMLVLNRQMAATNKLALPPLPICVVLQTAFDHNGAFHRDPFMTSVINRMTHLTLFAEGKDSLGAFGTELARFAKFGEGDKVDEVMVAGHGNAKLMELGGDKGIGKNRLGTMIYGQAKSEEVTVDKGSSAGELLKTDDFIKTIKDSLRDDPNSRVVLNACLTASNSIDGVVLDPDPVVAAKQIRDAIALDPSLATAMKTKLGTHQGQVRGANASFGKVKLLDGGGNIDIVSGTDPKLTAPKLEYAEGGTEPTGVLRATLESWGTDKGATIDALNRRLVAKGTDTAWRERVICSVMRLIVARPDDAQLISTLVGTAGALSHLTSRPECKVSALKDKVPTAHMDAIFTDLSGADAWTDPGFDFVPAVCFQVWVEKNNGKIGAFHGLLDASTFTTQNAMSFFDLAHLKPLIAQLVPLPGIPATPPRGTFLLALLYMVAQKGAAPAEVKAYIKEVVGVGKQIFPDTCNVDDLLKGASQQSVLENAGVIPKVGDAPLPMMGMMAPVGPIANLDTNHSGNNTIAVDSVTSTCRTHGTFNTNVYMLPSGNKIGSVPAGRTFNVVGKAKGVEKGLFTDTPNVDYLAIEHTVTTHQTVFVLAKDVQQ